MRLYLDTSAIVALLVTEAGGEAVARLLRTVDPAQLLISDWVNTEVASALSLKIRTGQLSVDGRADVAGEWRRLAAGIVSISVTAQAFEAAAEIVARHELGLRAGDALHLAIARAAGATVVTLDERMAKAAPEVSVPVAAL